MQVNVTQLGTPLLIVPIQGTFQVTFSGHNYQGQAGKSACLLPPSAWINRTETVSVLVINIDPIHIERVTQNMLGMGGSHYNLLIGMSRISLT